MSYWETEPDAVAPEGGWDDLTPKQAWALVHPYLLKETGKSFFLKTEKIPNGTIIHAACARVLVRRDGAVLVARDEQYELLDRDSYGGRSTPNNAPLNLSDVFDLAVKESGLHLSRRQYGNVFMAVAAKFDHGWRKGYEQRANRALMCEIAAALPEENRRIAYASGHGLFGKFKDCAPDLNLIATNIKLLCKVAQDDSRLLSLAVSALYNKWVLMRPDTAVSEIKSRLVLHGLSECGWRKLLRMNAIERRAWGSALTCVASRTGERTSDSMVLFKTLDLIARKNIKVNIYRPGELVRYFYDIGEAPSIDERIRWRLFVVEVVLHRLAAAQRRNKRALSIVKLELQLSRLQELYDYASGCHQLPPRGAGYQWLKRQSDAWHEEVFLKSLARNGDPVIWGDRVIERYGCDLPLSIEERTSSAALLTSSTDFFRESRKMHHCVSSRWQMARDGKCEVFHLYDAATDEHATLDVRLRENGRFHIFECRSFCNTDISASMRKFASLVARRLTEMRDKQVALHPELQNVDRIAGAGAVERFENEDMIPF